MVLAPLIFLPAIPSQPTTSRLIVVKLKQENCRQKYDQQHGLRSHHLLVFLWCKGCVLRFENEGAEGQLWFRDFPTRPHLLQQIKSKATTNKNFVVRNLNENQDFLLQTVLNFYFQE